VTGYATQIENYTLGGEAFTIRALLDRQQFSDPDGAAAALGITSATWPIFGMVWPSSLILAEHVAQLQLEPSCRVLEAGCGLALASLVLHRRGIDVTATDVHPEVPDFLRENLLLNHLPPMPCVAGDWANLHDSRLGCFNLVIGSDLLYDRDQPAQLAGFIDRHTQRKARVILVDADRGNRPAFTRALQAAGFTLETERRVHSLPANGEPYKGRLLTYQR
jgi:SAM-dependent methyltransferase